MQLICIPVAPRDVVFAHHTDDLDVVLGQYPAGAYVIPWQGRETDLELFPALAKPAANQLDNPSALAAWGEANRYAGHRLAPILRTPDQLKAYAASRRYYKSIAGVTVNGTLFGSDDTSEAKIAAKWTMFQINPKAAISWKALGGFATLDLAGFTAMAQAVTMYRESCFSAEQKADAGLKDGSITTVAQIDAVFSAAGV